MLGESHKLDNYFSKKLLAAARVPFLPIIAFYIHRKGMFHDVVAPEWSLTPRGK
jgi:hypothetical protein